MKQFILTALIFISAQSFLFAQSPTPSIFPQGIVPNAATSPSAPPANRTLGGSAGLYGGIAPIQTDNEALRRILYGQQNGTQTVIAKATGAALFAVTQFSASTTSAQAIAARATRRSVAITNNDAAITIYYGAGTVTSANGAALTAGQSQVLDTVSAINIVSASGTPKVTLVETYD